MSFTGFTLNGQLAAAVAVLVDAIFGVLYAMGTIHTQPDQQTVVGVVAVAFNIATYLLAYIQHSQSVVKAQLTSAALLNGKSQAAVR